MNDLNVNGIMGNLSTMALGMTVIISVAWIVVNFAKGLKQRANTRTRADIYNRLIDKFGSAPEFIDFLKSDAGLSFIEENVVQTAVPLSRILTAIQIGIVLSLLGAGLLITGNIFGGSLGGDLYIVLAVGGVIGLMIGLGFLISAAISYRLCKAWGLFTKSEKPQAI